MCFVGQKSIFRHYYIQNVKDRVQFQVYKINKESVMHLNQFISVKVKKISGSVSKKLRKLKLWENDDFLIKISLK